MSRYTKINLTLTSIIVALSIVAGNYLNGFIVSNFKSFEFKITLLLSKNTWIYAGLIFLALMSMLLLNDKGSIFKRMGKVKSIDVGLENSHFMSEREKGENFTITTLDNISNFNSGIVLGAKKLGNTIKITITKAIHTLIIGNTGSGKTSAFVIPLILLLAKFKDKPSMIIADPKAELFEKCSKSLENEGYKVHVIDLIEPLESTRWNPLSPQYDKYQEMVKLPKKSLERKKLHDDIRSEIKELVFSIFPLSKDVEDPMWEQGRNSFIEAVILAMLEDSEKEEQTGMCKAKFNFENVRNICSITDNDANELKIYFSKKNHKGEAKKLSNIVLGTKDKTQQSYFTTILSGLSIFSDDSLNDMMSSNEIDLNSFDEMPSVLFLKIPDERVSRYGIASAFFSNTYRTLVAKARLNENSKLKRPIHFIIDEFGNMPPIPNIDKMLAVSRSRNIFFTLILQSYEQLENVYGKAAGDIIKGNCNIEGFIGSKENGTLEEFSRKCGNKTVTNSSVRSSQSIDGEANISANKEPIIYPSELRVMNNGEDIIGNIIFVISGRYPVKFFFTPYFKCDLYEIGSAKINRDNYEVFYSEDNYYKINNEVATGEFDDIYSGLETVSFQKNDGITQYIGKVYDTSSTRFDKYNFRLTDKASNNEELTVFIDKVHPHLELFHNDESVWKGANDKTDKAVLFADIGEKIKLNAKDDSPLTITYGGNNYTNGQEIIVSRGDYLFEVRDYAGNVSYVKVVCRGKAPTLIVNEIEYVGGDKTSPTLIAFNKEFSFKVNKPNGGSCIVNGVEIVEDTFEVKLADGEETTIYNVSTTNLEGNTESYFKVVVDKSTPKLNINNIKKDFYKTKYYKFNGIFYFDYKNAENAYIDFIWQRDVKTRQCNNNETFAEDLAKGETVKLGEYFRYSDNGKQYVCYFSKENLINKIKVDCKALLKIQYIDRNKLEFNKLFKDMYESDLQVDGVQTVLISKRFKFQKTDVETVKIKKKDTTEESKIIEFDKEIQTQIADLNGFYEVTETNIVGTSVTYYIYFDNALGEINANLTLNGKKIKKVTFNSKDLGGGKYFYDSFSFVKIDDVDDQTIIKITGKDSASYYHISLDELPTLDTKGSYIIEIYDRSGNETVFTVNIKLSEYEESLPPKPAPIPEPPITYFMEVGGLKTQNVKDTNKDVKFISNFELLQIVVQKDYKKISYNFGEVLSEEGKYIVKILNSNSEKITTHRFSIDKTPPKITLENIGEKSITKENVIVTITEENTILELKGDEKKTKIESGATFSNDGSYTIIAADKVGNSSKISFTIDKTPPSVTLYGVENGGATTSNISMQCNEEVAVKLLKGGVETSYKLGNKIRDEGEYVVEIMDKAGNVTTYTFTKEWAVNTAGKVATTGGGISAIGLLITLLKKRGIKIK